MNDESLATPVLRDDYIILPCPACGKQVKIPTDSLGLRMGCTYCREPLEVAEYEPVVEETVDKKKQEKKPQKKRLKDEPETGRQPLVFRLLRDEDLGVDTNREFADEYERRRLPTDAPDWDDEKLLQKQRERDEAMAEAGDGVPAKRLLTQKEQIFRTITIVIMSASAVVAALIAYTVIVKMTGVVRTDGKTMKELPAEVRGKIAAVLEEQKEKPFSEFLTSKEEQAAVALINGFLQAKSNEDRLPFVRDPERVAPLMEEFYSREGTAIDWPVGQPILRDKLVDRGRYFIRLAIEFVGIGHRFYVVEQTRDDFKLDWETSVGYQPMPLTEFKAQRPTTPIPFRVKLKLSDYYNYQFEDRGDYQAVALSYPGDPQFKLTGYINRRQAWAPELIRRLEAGQGLSVIAEISFRAGDGAVEDDSQVEIHSIISDTWWL